MRQGLFLHRTYFFGTVPLLFLWSCGSGDSDASPVEPAGGASSGDSGASAGGAAAGGGATEPSGGAHNGSIGGASADGGSRAGGSASFTGGGDGTGGRVSAGGSGELPNWEANPPDAEFRACLDESGHTLVLLCEDFGGMHRANAHG